MTTFPQKHDLINNLTALLEAHRAVFGQQRVYLRVVALVFAELFAFHPRGREYVSRHTITQLLMTLGLTEQD